MLARVGRGLWRLSFDNPVLLKELRIGLREKRIFVVQIGFLLILGTACLLALASMLSGNDPQELPTHGNEYFQMLFWIQLVMLLLVTPGLTCGSLSGERERHSLDMVMASRLSTGELAAGKLGFAMYYVVLLLSSSLPMASVVFFLGGVSPWQAILAYLELGCWALLAGQIGLFFSARETRSNYATSQSYLVMILSCLTWLPTYVALRMAEPQPLAGFAEFHPLYVVAVLAIYLSVFLFVKTMHRLRPRAVHIKIMGWSFILVYLLMTVLMMLLMTDNLSDPQLDSSWQGFLMFLVAGNLAASGIFLNESPLDSPREQRLLERSLVSKQSFWLVVLSLGMLAPAVLDLAMGQPDDHFQLHLSVGLGVVYLLSLAVFVRGLQKVMPAETRFATLYFVILSLLCSLPTLGLLSENPGLFSGVYLSPFIAISSIWEPSSMDLSRDSSMTLAGYSVLAYMGLALLGTVLPLLRRKKPRAT